MSFNNNYDEMLPIFIIKNSNKELSAKYISKFSEVYKTCQLDLKKMVCSAYVIFFKGHAIGTCTISRDFEGCSRYIMIHLYIDLHISLNVHRVL